MPAQLQVSVNKDVHILLTNLVHDMGVEADTVLAFGAASLSEVFAQGSVGYEFDREKNSVSPVKFPEKVSFGEEYPRFIYEMVTPDSGEPASVHISRIDNDADGDVTTSQMILPLSLLSVILGIE